MRRPEEFFAISLARLPVDLEFVRDIEEFEGPLLSEFRSSDGETFLYHWCDCDERANRWLVFRAPRQDLFRYLVGRAPLRSLIQECRDGFLYVIDLDGDAKVLSAWFVYADKLPDNYLPGWSSARQPGSGIEPGFQDVYVDQNFEKIAEYPRKYLQTYAFHTAFGEGGDPGSLSLDYDFSGGWVFHTLFGQLYTNAPARLRASLAGVAIASPGYFRFRVDEGIAEGVRNAVARYTDHRPELRRMVEELRGWTTGRHEVLDSAVSELIREAAEVVGVHGAALLNHSKTPEHAAKVILSYLAHLDFLAANESKQSAMLVGLTHAGEAPHRIARRYATGSQ